MRIHDATLLLAALAGAALPLCGCGDGGQQARGDAVAVVEDPGGEPRQLLAPSPVAGRNQRVVLDQRMSMALEAGGERVPGGTVPGTRTEVAAEVEQAGEGGATIRFHIVSLELEGAASDPQADASLREALRLQNPAGRGGTLARAASGLVTSIDFPTPHGAPPAIRHVLDQLRQALVLLSVPLPEDPVGAGARWAWERPLQLSGMDLSQQATAHLLRVAGGTAVVGVTGRLRAAPQLLDLPQIPAGARCELLDLDAFVKGELHVRHDLPLPVGGALTCVLDMRLRVQHEKSVQEVRGHVTIEVQVEGRDGA